MGKAKVSDELLSLRKKPRAETCRMHVRPTDRREVTKINLFIFSAEVHPNFFSRRLEELVQVERKAKIKTLKKHFYCLSYSWNMSA